jgi:hypothetical protein
MVTDLIKALPGNGSVNAPTCNNTGETVFYIWSARDNIRNWVLCDQTLGYTTVLTTELCFQCGPFRGYVTRFVVLSSDSAAESCLCEGGVEYLHRDRASRKRRRKGKSQF